MSFDLFGYKDDKPKRRRILSHHKTEVLQGQKFKCADCGAKLTEHPKNYHIDHIKPLADGGKDIPSNMQALCGTCHTKKSDLEAGKRAEKKRKEKSKEKDPYSDLLGIPKSRGKKSKDPFSVEMPDVKIPTFDLGLTKQKKKKGKKKDTFSLY